MAARLIATLAWILSAAALFGAAPDLSLKPQVNLLVISDWGFSPPDKGVSEQQITARAMGNYALKCKLTFDAVLVGGDNFKVKLSGPDDPIIQDAFEQMYRPNALGMPFYVVMGSHDYEYGAATAELNYGQKHPGSRWKMPSRWYRLDLPMAEPLVTVLMLDSDQGEMGAVLWQAELQWMEAELSKPRKTAWTICVAHHPLFSDGRHGDNPAMQAAWGPLLKKHKVDFLITGHDHVLQHLQLPDWSTTFLISGGGGENTKRPIIGNRSSFIRATHGFAAMQLDANSAKVSLIDDTAKVLHVFERNRAGEIRILSTTPSDKP